MASAQVVETSVTNNSPSQDSYHPDDLFQSRYASPGFKPFSYNVNNCTTTTVPFKQETINFVPTLYSAVLVSKFKSKLTFICIILIVKRVGFWRNGESTHVPPKCPGFDFLISRHMWTEIVVLYSVLSSERFFPRYSGFPFSQKTNI